jgi:hypothetical protein
MKNAMWWLKASAIIAAVVGLLRLSYFVGWAMDNSILPPFGGGWRCYVFCFIAVWAIPVGAVFILSLPVLLQRVTKLIVWLLDCVSSSN